MTPIRLSRWFGPFSHPLVTVTRLARDLDVTYPTAKADADRLIAMDILHELPNSYPKAFAAGKIFNAAYRED
jgi:hypothetical protein